MLFGLLVVTSSSYLLNHLDKLDDALIIGMVSVMTGLVLTVIKRMRSLQDCHKDDS